MDDFLDQALEEFEEEEAKAQERDDALLDSILKDAMDEFEIEVIRFVEIVSHEDACITLTVATESTIRVG
jgi:hypothetical protein